MKRIFIIQNTPLNEPLPLSVFITNLLKNFSNKEVYELNLIIAKSDSIPEDIKSLFEKIYEIESDTYSIKDNFKFSFKVKSILKKEHKFKKISIVHCFYPNSSLLGAVFFKIFNNRKVKIIYDIRSPWIDMSVERGFINKFASPIYKKLLYFEEKILCKFVKSFVFVTPGLLEYYSKKVKIKKSQKTIAIPSGVDLDLFKKNRSDIRKQYNIGKNDILICSIGGIAKIRKLDEFLIIYKEIIKRIKNTKLLFVGDGDLLDQLKEKSRFLGLSDFIIFTGSISHTDIPKYISSSNYGLNYLPDIFIYRHSFSLKTLEYLGCEVPVIATKIKSNVEISKQLNGIFFFSNSDDLFDILSNKDRGISNPDLYRYSWPYLADRYYKEVYRQLL